VPDQAHPTRTDPPRTTRSACRPRSRSRQARSHPRPMLQAGLRLTPFKKPAMPSPDMVSQRPMSVNSVDTRWAGRAAWRTVCTTGADSESRRRCCNDPLNSQPLCAVFEGMAVPSGTAIPSVISASWVPPRRRLERVSGTTPCASEGLDQPARTCRWADREQYPPV